MRLLIMAVLQLVLFINIPSIAALFIQFKTSELQTLLQREFRLLITLFLRDIQIIKQFVGIIKGAWPALSMEIVKSCQYWTEETYLAIREYTRHDPRLQTFLLSPLCIKALWFAPKDLVISQGDYTALPYRPASSVPELINMLKALSGADPFGWYRFTILKTLGPFFYKACEGHSPPILEVDINSYIMLVPPFKTMTFVAALHWRKILETLMKIGTDPQRASIIFYLHKQFNRVDNEEEFGVSIIEHHTKHALAKWQETVKGNITMAKFLKFLDNTINIEKAPAFKELEDIGIDETSPGEFVNLAIYLTFQTNPGSHLLQKLGDLIQARSKTFVTYSGVEISHVLNHLYEACLNPLLPTFYFLARKVLGSCLVQRIINQVYLGPSWNHLLFILTVSERIVYFRRWIRGLPHNEWWGDTNQIGMAQLLSSNYTSPLRNGLGADLQEELLKAVKLLVQERLVGVVTSTLEGKEFYVEKKDIKQQEDVLCLIFFQTYLRLHYEDLDQSTVPIYSRNRVASLFSSQTQTLLVRRGYLKGLKTKLMWMLQDIYSFADTSFNMQID